jgi:hypothetical protein
MPIEIDQIQTEEKIKPAPEPEEKETEQSAPANVDQLDQQGYDENLEHELQVKLQPILLDSAITALGHTLAKLAKSDDLDFTEDEKKALVDCWTPLLPSVSPMTNAVLVTVIILSGKALLYASIKKQLKATETKALPVNSETVKEAID